MSENENVEPVSNEEIKLQSIVPIEEILPEEEGLPAEVEGEEKELTEEEIREIKIQALKDSHIKFHKLKHATITVGTHVVENPVLKKRKRVVKDRAIATNVTINQFGADYQKKRQRKNKMAKASRRANR
jgi:hypothetical protein